jgi:hypothetical protein
MCLSTDAFNKEKLIAGKRNIRYAPFYLLYPGGALAQSSWELATPLIMSKFSSE